MGHLFLDFFLFISISLQFSPNWRVFLAIPQKFLANSLHVSILMPTFAIATIYMWSIPHGVEMPETEYGGSPSTCFLALCGG